MTTPLIKKLQLKKTKIATVTDEKLATIAAGEEDLQQDYGGLMGGGGGYWTYSCWFSTYAPCSCAGNSDQPYRCDTNSTCAATQCITCTTVCTCLGQCS